jgi:hypothetical protein
MTATLTAPAEAARVGSTGAHASEVKEQAMPETKFTPPRASRLAASGLALVVAAGATACTPTLRIEASDKPITINLNVKIDQEIRYRLDKDLEDTIAANPNLF